VNTEAKIGLFAVLVLVVLMVVIWAKLAGEDVPNAPGRGPVAADPASTSDQTMTAKQNLSGTHPASPGTSTDAAQPHSSFTDVLTHTYDGLLSAQKDTSSEKEEFDPYSYYDEDKTTKKTKSFDDIFGTDVIDDISADREKHEQKAESDRLRHWADADAGGKKTGEKETSETFTTTTTFDRLGTRPPEWPKEHVVSEGETLSDISTKYYQTSKHWQLIADANRAVVPDPDRIWAGMKLKIPPPPTPRPQGQAAPELVPKPGSKYKVRKGDTLSSISQVAYGTASAWETILAENRDRLSAPEELAEGMIISIPAGP